MLTSISDNYPLIISLLVALAFVFLVIIFFAKKQDPRLNWAIFYGTLYVLISLPTVNYLCVQFQLWSFPEETNSIQLPFNLYFLWTVIWSIVPIYFLKGKYILILAVFLFWIDISIMPVLQSLNLLILNKNWLLGEIALILFVFLPSYYWATCSYQNKYIGFRAAMQVLTMGCIFLIGLPFILKTYGLVDSISIHAAPYLFQIFLIVIFPSLVAVHDLVQKGGGTPFPYDPTQNLIQTGVYAYCRNPIQWSFTFMFIPISIYYSSYFFLIGSVFSIAYAFGVSDFQEYEDMKVRFGLEWEIYKKSVPKWRFLWRPTNIPKGQVYFDANCIQCSQLSKWFLNSKALNLEIKTAFDYPKNTILQVTYIDHNGLEFKSVNAIACCLEHINLAYATLGWFMRFPFINPLLQLIVDTMEFGDKEESCEVK